MVKKLWKHEFAALARTLLPIQGIALCVALLFRVLQLFETDHFVYNILFGSSVFFLVVALVVCLCSVSIFSIVRFYRHLFTNEGYLSFTLPVTPAQHIWVKLSAAVVFSLIADVVVLAAVSLATAGEVFHELILALEYLMNLVLKLEGGVHILWYLPELVITLLAVFIGELLFFYTCITIGQLAKKNRVLAAVGVYFAFYVVSQIFSTVITIVFTFFGEPIVEAVAAFFETYQFAAGHLVFLAIFLLTAVMGAAWFIVTHTIIRKRLNLE